MIELPRAVYDELVHRADDGDEREVCGLLAGTFDAERTVVEAVYPAENVAESPETRYRIDPEEQLARTEAIEASGLDVAGFYHSHPAGPSSPSPTDVERATWPGVSYVIVSMDGDPSVGSWRWRGEEETFAQEPVAIADADERVRD